MKPGGYPRPASSSAIAVLGVAEVRLNPRAVLGRQRRGFRERRAVSKRACVTAQVVDSGRQGREIDQDVGIGLAKRDRQRG